MGADSSPTLPCTELPLLGQDDDGRMITDCDKAALARRLYDETAKGTVRIFVGAHAAGTGFLVRQGDEVVTAAHVAAAGSSMIVEKADGTLIPAELEKLDDIDDLALLKLRPPDGGSAQDIQSVVPLAKSSAAAPNAFSYVLGHPLGDSRTWMSPGIYEKTGALRDGLGDMSHGADAGLTKIFHDQTDSPDPQIRAASTAFYDSPRDLYSLHIEPGNSGGPVLNQQGKIVGVATIKREARNSDSELLAVPVEKVQSLLDGPEQKFDFQYFRGSELERKPARYIAESVATAAFLSLAPKPVSAILGAWHAFSIPDDMNKLSDPNRTYWHKSDMAGLAEDAAFMAGGVVQQFSSVPARYKLAIFAGAIGLSLLEKGLYQEDYLQKILPKNGSYSPPIGWTE